MRVISDYRPHLRLQQIAPKRIRTETREILLRTRHKIFPYDSKVIIMHANILLLL